MEIGNDIRQIKKELRLKYRAQRETLTPEQKRQKDDAVFSRVIATQQYQQASLLLCFVSTSIEIDTHRLLTHSFKNNKRVAVPKCLDKNGSMGFFYIRSLSDLQRSTFGILEPIESCPKCEVFEKTALCIVPGFAFDMQGYRIGYGKGYYDRFLKQYTGLKMGICYNEGLTALLPHGRRDITVDYIATEKFVMTIKNKATSECAARD